MKYVKHIKKTKGFTLVELLVVIIIIGVLAGTLVMSVTSIQEEAEFAKMVSDLRTMKAAARLYFAENGRNLKDTEVQNIRASIDKYMDRKMTDNDLKYYYEERDGSRCVGARFYTSTDRTVPKAVIGGITHAALPEGLKKKFKDRANKMGFKNSFGDPWKDSGHRHIYIQLY